MEPNEYTCGKCGKEMRFNVPRLGPDGGFVHADTGSLDCGNGDRCSFIILKTPPQTQKFEFRLTGIPPLSPPSNPAHYYECRHCFDTGYLDVMGGKGRPCPFCGERIKDL